MDESGIERREIPAGKHCSGCPFDHLAYYNEEDDIGTMECSLFGEEAIFVHEKVPQCLEKFLYGGTVTLVAKGKFDGINR